MVRKRYQKWLFFALLAGFLAFFDVLPAFADNSPIIIQSFNEDFSNGDKITIHWRYNAAATPDTVESYQLASGDLHFLEAYHASNNRWYLYGFLTTCTSDATNVNCYSIPTKLKQNNGSDWWYVKTNVVGLTYDDISAYLDAGEMNMINKSYGYRAAVGGGGDLMERDVAQFNFGDTPIVYPLNPHITISSPASGSTITATNDTLSVNYYDIDPTIYKDISLNFWDDKLHSATTAYNYKLATGDTGNGSFTVGTSAFGFNTNGHWDLKAMAHGYSLNIIDNLYLSSSPSGYVDVFSNDLVIPPYYLILNVSGYAAPFTMSDWPTWYGANVSDYATPEPFASTLAGYLQPYFEKVGGFGAQASLYFNLDEAYDRGFGLGSIFPIMDGYIHKIDMFFGGFPLFTFFKYIIYTMIGIFVVRTILKFIPFIG